MRIISQDGKLDLPYEMCILNRDYRKENIIVAAIAGCGEIENICQMAKYSTETKAIKAMEMLREAYTGKLICQNIDLSDDKVVELLKNWKMQAITVANSDTTRCDYINNTVFQFPADEDVEVDDET